MSIKVLQISREANRGKILLLLSSFTIFLFIFIGLIFLEVYFHFRFHDAICTRFDYDLGWANQANCSKIHSGKKYTTNSYGFRNREINRFKEHILIVGDSVVWGSGVNDQETVTHYLDQKTNEQVINMGGVPVMESINTF